MTMDQKPRFYTADDTSHGPSHVTIDAMATGDSHTNGNGHLVVDCFLSCSGIFDYLASEIKSQWPDNAEVQSYDDGAVLRAYRAPNAVTNQEYLDSAKYVPVTDNHPPHMLHPDNMAGYPVGTSTEKVSVDEGRPRAQLVLWDKRAINARKQGKKDISLGCYNRFVWGAGTTDSGAHYDFEIRDSVINHIAIVDRGRAGAGVAILDAASVPVKRKTMDIQIGGATFDIDDNAAKLLLKERADSRASLDRLDGQLAALKARTISMDDAAVKELVEQEIVKRESATKDQAIRQSVKDAGFDVEGKSMDHILGVHEGLGLGTIDAGVHIAAVKTTADTKTGIATAKQNQYRG